MLNMLYGIHDLAMLDGARSRAINAENPTGEKGGGGRAASKLGTGRKGHPSIPVIQPNETVCLADIDGTGTIEHIWMTVSDKTSDKNTFVLRDLILRIYWDGQENMSVECPLGDFFCCGFGLYYPVNALPINVNPTRGFNCYFPMPFRKHARVTIENRSTEPVRDFFYQIDYSIKDSIPETAAYFHAQWRRQRITRSVEDYIILDNVNGSGRYIGTFLALTTLERYWWGEGEIKFYLDGDDRYPTICGTGTEDYFGGAWSFACQRGGETVEQTFSSPFLGYPFYSNQDERVHNEYHTSECPPMRALYRFHILDPIRFTQDIRVTIQQLGSRSDGLFERQDDLSSVAFWYQTLPSPVFPKFPSCDECRPR